MISAVTGVLLLLASGTGAPDTSTYYFGANPARTDISFSSKTEITNILGTTKTLEGSAEIDFESGSGTCHLIVPVLTLNTGMDDRDRAMFNDTWMDAEKYPTIQFKASKAVKKSERTWEISGTFTFRGVERDLTITADILQLPDRFGKRLGEGSWVRVKTEFVVDITKHGLKIPAKSIATVNPTWKVAINIFGTTAKPTEVPVAARKNVGELELDIRRNRLQRARRLNAEGLTGTIYEFGKLKQLSMMSATSMTEIQAVQAQSHVIHGFAGIQSDGGTGQIRLNISVHSLKTGIDQRDATMLGPDWLDAANHRYITFESTKATLKGDDMWRVEGNFTLRGETRPIAIDVRMRQVPLELVKAAGWGDQPGLGFRTKFTIKLSDYGITIPEMFLTKVNDEWTIQLDLVALLRPS